MAPNFKGVTPVTLGESTITISESQDYQLCIDQVDDKGETYSAPKKPDGYFSDTYARVTRRFSRRRWQHIIRFKFAGEFRVLEFVTVGNPYKPG